MNRCQGMPQTRAAYSPVVVSGNSYAEEGKSQVSKAKVDSFRLKD